MVLCRERRQRHGGGRADHREPQVRRRRDALPDLGQIGERGEHAGNRGNGADPETLRRYLEAKDALAKAELAWIAAGLPIVGNVLNDMRSCYGAMLKAHETLLSVAGIGYWRSNGR